VTTRDRQNGDSRTVRAKFVFVGAGGGSLPLLQRARLPEAKGLGGFPIGGRWLVCDDPAIVAKVKAGDPVTLREFAEDRAIAGTPGECADQVRQYAADVAATHVCVVLQAADEGAATRTLELFGRNVIPAVR